MKRALLAAVLLLPLILWACNREEKPGEKPEEGKDSETEVIPATSVTLDRTEISLAEQNITHLVATVKPDDCTEAVVWETSNAAVAKVEDGSVTGVSTGIAVITAKAGSKTAECKVYVVPVGAIDLGVVVTRQDGSKYRVFWAQSNMDSDRPDRYGNYFAWGEYNVHYNTLSPLKWKSGMEAGYAWSDYKWARGSGTKLTKYCPTGKSSYWGGPGSPDGKTLLDKGDDIASEGTGGKWRLPTRDEWDALKKQCSMEWSSWNSTKGVYFQSKVVGNTNKIFLPFAGTWDGTTLNNEGKSASYWSNALYSDTPSSAYVMKITLSSVDEGLEMRNLGLPVRAVISLD